MKTIRVRVYKLNLIGRPEDEVFADDEIHFICRCFTQGLTNQEILSLVNRDYPKGSIERLHVLSILNRIKSKKRFTRISDLYFKEPIS